jgi:dephospho-CoA kinase
MGVASIALLYRQTMRDFDFVVVTFCPPETRRGEYSIGIAFQKRPRCSGSCPMPAGEKARRADFVIQTGGTADYGSAGG